jgi:hypothetical protein
MKRTICMATAFFVILLIALPVFADEDFGTSWLSIDGKDSYIRITNGVTTVVLDPYVGGRVIEYSLDGVNALYRAPKNPKEGERVFTPDSGRFDIGPEQTSPSRPMLWSGEYTPQITGEMSARLTSQFDESSGVRIMREFSLDRDTSQLVITQTILNESDEEKIYNYWSRTFGTGHGIAVVPLSDLSRFRNGYIYYGPGPVLNVGHDPHPAIETRDGYLILKDTPPQPKFGIDSHAGWLAYLEQEDLCFVKRFPTYPCRPYGEVAAYTISLWYFEDVVCELEPIGPREFIAPGGAASYTVEWWLAPYDFPTDREVDLDDLVPYLEATTGGSSLSM